MRTTSVQPNPENATLDELRVAMDAAPTKRSYIRLAAIRALLLGFSRPQVCQLFDRSDRMLRLWIDCFNRAGVDALLTQHRAGRPRTVPLDQVRQLVAPLLESPAQGHWTGVKLHGYLRAQLAQDFGYRSLIRWLHELDYHLRVPRPWPERQNEQERQEFLEQLRARAADVGCELWFADECGVEGDPRPRRRWAQPGRPCTVPYLGDHIRQNVVGAVCPASGQLVSLIVDSVDTDVFQVFLDQLAETVPKREGVRPILILDNASWHKTRRLQWHHFEPWYLPAYSPDFNPIERLWLRLKADWFWDYIAHSDEELRQRLCAALKSFIDDAPQTASICAFRK